MPNSLKTLANLLLITMALLFTFKSAHASGPVNEFEQAMEQYKGKVVYVDFWASWCIPCRKSFPWMNTMQAKHQDQGFVVLSINLDAEETLAKKFLKLAPANFAIIYDAKGKLAQKFKLKGMPSSYLFDRQGKLISAHTGFNGKKQQQYEQEISQALAR
ncbi:thioredoxin [Colwellia psychrerythraea]|uniref:Thioredoxin n=1 Tax=Colwellia psychrerythraea TaxID=28229 RepID=A0A1Y5EBS6_COLPS|nr:thioredoxin [Colwellia psychrerythraea]